MTFFPLVQKRDKNIDISKKELGKEGEERREKEVRKEGKKESRRKRRKEKIKIDSGKEQIVLTCSLII